MTESNRHLPLIVMGVNDQYHCLRGWFFREYDGRNGVCYRWTAQEALFRLMIPRGARAIRLMVTGAAGLTGRPCAFSLMTDDKRIAHFPEAASTDFWSIVEVSLEGLEFDAPEKEFFFTIRNEEHAPETGEYHPRYFIPDEYLGNGDPRTMGVMVAAIRVV